MTIESQLERICVALEILAKSSLSVAAEMSTIETSTKTENKPKATTETKKPEPKPEPQKTAPTPEATNTEQGGASLGDLQEKVKALAAKAGRDAVIEVFKGFKIDRMSELDAAQYVAMDLALAKAITKANEE